MSTITADHIPNNLKALEQWVVWRKEERDGRPTKVLYQARRPDRHAKVNDRRTFATYEQAVLAVQLSRKGNGRPLDGIGFVFTEDDPYCGVDIDHCLTDGGQVAEWARPHVESLAATYGEISPSRGGIHFIAVGRLDGPGKRRNGYGADKAGAIEIYDRGRYFTITGDIWNTEAPVIVDLSEPIAALYAEVQRRPTEETPPKAGASPWLIRATNAPDVFDRARAYLAKVDPAISGRRGHDQCFKAACKGCVEFGLREDEAFNLLWTEYNPRCVPPWSEAELRHKVADAYRVNADRLGAKLNEDRGRRGGGGKGAGRDAKTDAPEPPQIEITTKRHLVVEEVLKVLPEDRDLYCRGGQLVTVAVEEADSVKLPGGVTLKGVAGTPKVIPLSEAVASCFLTRNASFYEMRTPKKGEPFPVDVHPPDWLSRNILTRGHWPKVRALLSIVDCPYSRSDGSIVETIGYDRATATLYRASIAFPPIPKRPTRDDARAAWGRLRGVVEQFPFETEDDAAVYLAGLLNALARPAIDGPVPGVAVNGNKPSTGKGLLVNTISNIAYGRNAPTSAYPYDRDEAGKLITAIAGAAKPIIHFDNLDEGSTYGNSALDSALTSEAVDNRSLGTLKMTGETPLRTTWFLSGNNVSPGKDAYRRWLVCNLITELERPEERRDIAIADLRSHVLEHRAELVRDALTILRAHALDGYPHGDWAPLGSFEAWDRVVRGAVWFATDRDCCATRRKAADDSPARKAKVALLAGWMELPEGKDKGVTATKAVELVEKNPEKYETLRNALLHFGKDGKPAGGRAVGYLIRGLKGNVVEGMKFVQGEEEHGSLRWIATGGRGGGDGGDRGDRYPPNAEAKSDQTTSSCSHTEKTQRDEASNIPPIASSPPPGDDADDEDFGRCPF